MRRSSPLRFMFVLAFLVFLLGSIWYFLRIAGDHPEEMSMKDAGEMFTGETNVIPMFSSVQTGVTHRYHKAAHPFLGVAVLDIDGDGGEELFVGGGHEADDVVLTYRDGRFVRYDGTPTLQHHSATLSATTIDIDRDGDTDLLITRDSGIYLLENRDGMLVESRLDIDFPEHVIPFSLSIGDINRDGLVDMYVNTFISVSLFRSATFNDLLHRTPNRMLLGRGNGTFTDITELSGLAFSQNTFQSVFVDLDGDGWQDLVVAPNTDRPKIYRNNRDKTFTEVSIPVQYGFWMGLAVADTDLDGDMDIFFSNVGETIPERLLRGDLRGDQTLETDWVLLRNDGDMMFTRDEETRGLSGYEFAWGAVFSDLNLDGREDLVVAENYIKWPPHKLSKDDGRVFIEGDDGVYHPVTEISGTENPYFGISPVIADIDMDGKPDIIYANVDGPVRVLFNTGDLPNDSLTVRLTDIARSLGTTVAVETESGERYVKQFMKGTGLGAGQTSRLIFGIPAGERISRVHVIYPDRSTRSYTTADIRDGVLIVTE